MCNDRKSRQGHLSDDSFHLDNKIRREFDHSHNIVYERDRQFDGIGHFPYIVQSGHHRGNIFLDSFKKN